MKEPLRFNLWEGITHRKDSRDHDEERYEEEVRGRMG